VVLVLQPPLTGEPLPLDLVNTRWVEDGRDVDLFDDPEALASWLRERDLLPVGDATGERCASGAGEPGALGPLVRVRAAIRGLLEDEPGAAERFGAVLDHGRLRLTLTGGRPDEDVEIDDPDWTPAWTVARAHLQLLASAAPGRIRHCDGAGCVLWFLDTSRNGTRRWCSMAGCGNRAKAQLHYRRHRATGPGAPRPESPSRATTPPDGRRRP
jgi:predicted RNA-binding Zn ribbon-like protein